MANVTNATKNGKSASNIQDRSNQILSKIFGERLNFSNGQRMTITPEIASELLSLNQNNRRVRKGHVSWLAKQMEYGLWLWAGDSIKVSKNARLLDKQHTLMAICESQTSHDFIIVGGLEESVFDVLDTGISRTAADALDVAGVKNATNVAATIRKVLYYKNKYFSGFDSSQKGYTKVNDEDFELITNATILDIALKDYDYWQYIIRNAITFYDSFRAVSASFWGSFYHLAYELDEGDAYEFCTKVSTGLGLRKAHPTTVLRRKLEADMRSVKKHSNRDKLYWFVHCWNKFRSGSDLRIIKHSHSPEIPEMI